MNKDLQMKKGNRKTPLNEFERIKSKLLGNKWVAYLLAFFFVISLLVKFSEDVKKIWSDFNFSLSKPSLFKSDNSHLKILLVPFRNDLSSDKEIKIHNIIKDRIEKLKLDDSLKLEIVVYKEVTDNFNIDSAKQLLNQSDLVIYGNYYSTTDTSAKTTLNYCLNAKKLNLGRSINVSYGLNYEVTLSEISNGRLQGNIDFIFYWVSGLTKYFEGSYKSSIRYFNLCIKRNNKFNTAFFYLGNANFYLNNNSEAIDNFNKAITIDSNDYRSINNRGYIYLIDKKYISAIEDFNKAIRINPYFIDSYNNRGIVQVLSGNYENAFADFQKAKSINPKFAAAYVNIANINVVQGKNSMALSNLDLALNLDSRIASAYNTRGVIYQSSNNINEALKNFDKAIKLNPNFKDAYFNRGQLYKLKIRDFSKAINDFSKVVTLDEMDFESFNSLGISYSYLSQNQSAINSFNKSLLINPNYDLTYCYRGSVYLTINRIDLAIKDYEKAVELNPSNQDAYNNLQFLYEKRSMQNL